MKHGKRQGGWLSKIVDKVLGEYPPTTQDGYAKGGNFNNISNWDSSFDNTPLDGDIYVNGQRCTTIGEYKAATSKHGDMGGHNSG